MKIELNIAVYQIEKMQDLAEKNDMTVNDVFYLLYEWVDDMIAYYKLKE